MVARAGRLLGQSFAFRNALIGKGFSFAAGVPARVTFSFKASVADAIQAESEVEVTSAV